MPDRVNGGFPPGDAEDLVFFLDQRARAMRLGRVSRVLRDPGKLLPSKLLELGLSFCGRTRTVEARTFWGDTMRVVLPEIVSLAIQRYGFFDEGTTRFLLRHVKPGMTVFDVGAHYGYFTLLASRLVGPTGSVHAFEPTPGTCAVLERNAGTRENVRLNNLAVHGSSGTLEMFDYGHRFSAFNSVALPRLPKAMLARLRPTTLRARAVSLDEYASGKLPPNFVKIDAEGSEYQVLSGMANLITSFHPAVAVEVGDLHIPGVSLSRNAVRFLLDRGYEAYEHREGEIVPHAPRSTYADGNLLFLPA
jgi:FkbM family methyltransferase